MKKCIKILPKEPIITVKTDEDERAQDQKIKLKFELVGYSCIFK